MFGSITKAPPSRALSSSSSTSSKKGQLGQTGESRSATCPDLQLLLLVLFLCLLLVGVLVIPLMSLPSHTQHVCRLKSSQSSLQHPQCASAASVRDTHTSLVTNIPHKVRTKAVSAVPFGQVTECIPELFSFGCLALDNAYANREDDEVHRCGPAYIRHLTGPHRRTHAQRSST